MMIQEKFCLFLGGDHSVSIPLESALTKAHSSENIGIIHFDSHCDLADEYDRYRWSHAFTQRRALELPSLKPHNLTLVGIRSFMEDELAFLVKHPQIAQLTEIEKPEESVDSSGSNRGWWRRGRVELPVQKKLPGTCYKLSQSFDLIRSASRD